MRAKIDFRLILLPVFFLASIRLANAADFGGVETSGNPMQRPAIVDWHSVESADYQTYVKNLEAVGCPPKTIRSIVTADVVKAFAGKRAAAVATRYRDFKYWQADPSETAARAKLASERHAIDEEMNGVLQQLLGSDTDLPDVSRVWQRAEWNQSLAFLKPEKREATETILEHYAKVNRQMKELATGALLTEDTNALQQVLEKYQREKTTLQQVLSSEEFRQVELTTSWTAKNLRHALVHFEPTQEEFDIIFDAWQPLDEKLAEIHATRQHDPGNLQEEAYAKIKARLSAARYQQYCDTWWK